MTCRACLRLASKQLHRLAVPVRSISTSLPKLSASPAPPAQPTFSTPTTTAQTAGAAQEGGDGKPAPLNISSCPAGTVMKGLNYIKGKQDPVALPDEEYPDWLWTCLDRGVTGTTTALDDAGDEFSKSKKQRRLAAKKKRQEEARILASGDLSALEPKIPLAKQTINLPGDGNTVDGNVEALRSREQLRLAMRKERKIKIRENNYLRSM